MTSILLRLGCSMTWPLSSRPSEAARLQARREGHRLPVPGGRRPRKSRLATRDSLHRSVERRIVTELVEQGKSATVETAVAKAGKSAIVAKVRQLRRLLEPFRDVASVGCGPGTIHSGEGSYRGDFQMHSTWSDGAERVGTMAEAAMELGQTCLGITDRSYGLPIARGMSMEHAAKQWTEIDRLNTNYEGRFRIFKGIEANILIDGGLDLQPDECARFEYMVASPHSVLRKADDQTPRMINAMRPPGSRSSAIRAGGCSTTVLAWRPTGTPCSRKPQRSRGDRAGRQLAPPGSRLPLRASRALCFTRPHPAALLLVVAVAASLVPARRATRIQPVDALRDV